MSSFKLLVKKHFEAGVSAIYVHGLTDSDEVARAWESAHDDARCIDVDNESSISFDSLPLADKL